MPVERISRGNYIHGQFVKVKDPSGEVLSLDPGDIDQPGLPFLYSYAHVDESIASAREGFQAWRKTPSADRFSLINQYRTALERRQADIASALSSEIGKPLWESKREVQECLDLIDRFLSSSDPTHTEHKVDLDGIGGTGRYRYAPRGVMVVLAPSTMPLYLSHSHFIPALLYGNSVVIKSSKFAPFSSQHLAEVANDAGLPAGILNLVHGDDELSKRLVMHPDVNSIFFTGSYEKARQIRTQIAGDYWKTFVLTAGGKNPTLVWDDADYKKALYETIFSAFTTAGQRHSSCRRILVHESLYDKFVTDFHALSKKLPIGYGLSEDKPAPFMGPLVAESKLQNYLRYQGIAIREGCEELMRGKALEREKRGHYVSPSIHLVHEPNPKSVYEQNEIFGPNVAIYKVKEVEQATQLLNQSPFGLVASVYTGQQSTFQKVLEALEMGIVHWNYPCISNLSNLPIGGIKKSGNARPMGSLSYLQCTHPISSVEVAENTSLVGVPPCMPQL